LALIVLISGRGSNMAAIAAACRSQRIHGVVQGVIADRAAAPGLQLAQQLGLATQIVSFRDFATRPEFETALARAIDTLSSGCARRLIVLAGFMRILGADFVGRYAGEMLNIHPSLLPAYRGLDTHARALADGATQHGASVHYVTPELDGGPVIAQVAVPVQAGDNVASLSARVQRGEHMLYPEVISLIAAGRVRLGDRGVEFDGAPLLAPRRQVLDVEPA
jgi:phosphoribosylglycinamide formyltransferase-1